VNLPRPDASRHERPDDVSPPSHDVRRYLRSKVTWGWVYRATSYLKSALWTVPIVAIVVVLLIAPPLRWLDEWLAWQLTGLDIEGRQAMFQTVITLTLSFLVFTFGSLLVAIQIAGGQLTPRIIATMLLRDNIVRYSVGLFVFTLVFSVSALNRAGESPHQLVALFTAILGIACIADFLFLIDYAARLLRPVSVLARVGDDGLRVIEAVYPRPATTLLPETIAERVPAGRASRVVPYRGSSATVLAVDLPTLLTLACQCDGMIEFVPQVGDFVATDEPLFVLHGGATVIDDRLLQTAVALGPERTLEQDPMFAFRMLVDIGLKALSPAINDPTTAVLAIDQVHRLLRAVGRRQLRGEAIPDDAGHPRVIFRTPNWGDYVDVACTEIRSCGANNVQIARRLRALLGNLIKTLPERRHAALLQQVDLLDRAIESLYGEPEIQALARIPDVQGLGGARETTAPGDH
jgi:uncharacterized membrane protein